MVLAMLEQVVFDPEKRQITALKPKPSFIPLFRQSPNLREQDGRFSVGRWSESQVTNQRSLLGQKC